MGSGDGLTDPVVAEGDRPTNGALLRSYQHIRAAGSGAGFEIEVANSTAWRNGLQ